MKPYVKAPSSPRNCLVGPEVFSNGQRQDGRCSVCEPLLASISMALASCVSTHCRSSRESSRSPDSPTAERQSQKVRLVAHSAGTMSTERAPVKPRAVQCLDFSKEGASLGASTQPCQPQNDYVEVSLIMSNVV